MRSVPRIYNEEQLRLRENGMQLDKKKPGIGNIRGLNLAAVKSTTVQVSDCRF
jgi:hypothetical protein